MTSIQHETNRKQILDQIHYYFSDENLAKDAFLRDQRDGERWVSMQQLCTFKKLETLLNAHLQFQRLIGAEVVGDGGLEQTLYAILTDGIDHKDADTSVDNSCEESVKYVKQAVSPSPEVSEEAKKEALIAKLLAENAALKSGQAIPEVEMDSAQFATDTVGDVDMSSSSRKKAPKEVKTIPISPLLEVAVPRRDGGGAPSAFARRLAAKTGRGLSFAKEGHDGPIPLTEYRLRRIHTFNENLVTVKSAQLQGPKKSSRPGNCPIGASTTDDSCCVCVSGLADAVTEELLWELMMQVGPVNRIYMPREQFNTDVVGMEAFVRDLMKQPHRGRAYVQYQHRDSVAYACYALNMLRLCGRSIRVYAQVDPTDPMNRRNGGDVCPLEQYGPLSFDKVMVMDGVPSKFDEAAVYDLLLSTTRKYKVGGSDDSLQLYPNSAMHVEIHRPPGAGGAGHNGFGLLHIRGIANRHASQQKQILDGTNVGWSGVRDRWETGEKSERREGGGGGGGKGGKIKRRCPKIKNLTHTK
jgi:hypothetical protein